MTDPRLAALAEALPDVMDQEQTDAVYVGLSWLDAPHEWYTTPRKLAAAILAALPPDWCGHGAVVHDVILPAQDEIARLRKIEEAALKVCDYLDADWSQTVVPDGRVAALHAALGGES